MAGLSRGQAEAWGIFSEYLDLFAFSRRLSIGTISCVICALNSTESTYLQAGLASHLPVDLVVIVLRSMILGPSLTGHPVASLSVPLGSSI